MFSTGGRDCSPSSPMRRVLETRPAINIIVTSTHCATTAGVSLNHKPLSVIFYSSI
jgi:hypothetical protein